MGFLDYISQFFTNLNGIGLAIYYGILIIVGIVFVLNVAKNFVPAILNPRLREGTNFQARCVEVGVAFVILVFFLTLPLWINPALEYFGASGSTVTLS